MNNIYLKIEEALEEDGFYYEMYKSEDDLITGENGIDGGLCTGTMSQAVEMATDQLKDLTK